MISNFAEINQRSCEKKVRETESQAKEEHEKDELFQHNSCKTPNILFNSQIDEFVCYSFLNRNHNIQAKNSVKEPLYPNKWWRCVAKTEEKRQNLFWLNSESGIFLISNFEQISRPKQKKRNNRNHINFVVFMQGIWDRPKVDRKKWKLSWSFYQEHKKTNDQIQAVIGGDKATVYYYDTRYSEWNEQKHCPKMYRAQKVIR